MLADQEVYDFVRRLSYKPGWSIRVEPRGSHSDLARPEMGTPSLWLAISFRSESSRDGTGDPDGTISVLWGNPIHEYATSDYGALRNFVHAAIRGLESHETDEWFALDGVCVSDPHGLKNQKVRPPDSVRTIRVPAPRDSYTVEDLW